MSDAWFFHRDLAPETITLAGDEAHHAAATRRLRVGETIRLFDGTGGMARATITAITDRGRAIAAHIEERERQTAPSPDIHLSSALPKGDRQATLLDMATQLGVRRFTPLECARSVVKPGAGARARWERICLEACKQSRRAHVPVIEEPVSPDEAARRAIARGDAVWIAHPDGETPDLAALPASVTLMIGPEGGFSEEEVADVETLGGNRVALGDGILRIETAAVALIALIRLSAAR